jgi:hypothetical protein
VPVAEALRKAAPLAAVLGHIQDRVDDLKIAERDVATLHGQKRLDTFELLGGNFHAASKSHSVNRP